GLAEAAGQRHMRLVIHVDKVFDSELSAKQSSIARCSQVAEWQHVGIERIENIHLIAGRDPPVVVLELAECVKRQKPVSVGNDRVGVEIDPHEAARLEVEYVGTGEHGE